MATRIYDKFTLGPLSLLHNCNKCSYLHCVQLEPKDVLWKYAQRSWATFLLLLLTAICYLGHLSSEGANMSRWQILINKRFLKGYFKKHCPLMAQKTEMAEIKRVHPLVLSVNWLTNYPLHNYPASFLHKTFSQSGLNN